MFRFNHIFFGMILLLIYIIYRTGMISSFIGEHFSIRDKFAITCDTHPLIINKKDSVKVVDCS
jgi:hypothetical protein